jgi:hypothetical protein
MVTGAASGDVPDVYTHFANPDGGARVTNHAGQRGGIPLTILFLNAKQAKEII